MQYTTPQFIEEEGKIIFFLTFRQFFLLIGGGAVCVLFFYTLPLWLFIVLAVPIVLLVVVIAFVKVNNESAVKILLHFIGFSFGKKNYLWKKKEFSYPIGAEETLGAQPSQLNNTKKIIETKK